MLVISEYMHDIGRAMKGLRVVIQGFGNVAPHCPSKKRVARSLVLRTYTAGSSAPTASL